jgi:hypothetical protein
MKRLMVCAILLGWTLPGLAEVILSDPFANDNLGTAPAGTNGGFFAVSSGGGSVTETNGEAQITSAPIKDDVNGMLSSNTVSLSDAPGATTLKTTWNVAGSDLKAKSSSLTFTWQTTDSLAAPDIGVILDLNNTNAYLYIGDTTNVFGEIELSDGFGDPGQAFSLVATFTSGAFLIEGGGTLKSGSEDVLSFGGSWPSTRSFGEEYHIGALVNANGKDGLVVRIGSVEVEAIPEPAVVSLIGLCGGGMIFYRRIFGRKNPDRASSDNNPAAY